MPPAAFSHWRYSVIRLSITGCEHLWSCTKSLLTRYLKNRLWECHQIYNFDAVGDVDELIRFWSQRWRSQRDHSCWNKHFERHDLICHRNAWTHFHEMSQFLICRPAGHWWNLQGHVFKGQGHRQFSELQFCSFAVETYQSMLHQRRPRSLTFMSLDWI